jgi:tetratricopeptide (TPR) repeat protein
MTKQEAATFEKQLKRALKHVNDPDRLAAESVLATAYFLGNAKVEQAEPHWGKVLGEMLRQAAHTLWGAAPPRRREEIEAVWSDILAAPGTPRYSYLVLELRYFQEFFRPRSLQQIWTDFLQQSRAEFYRDVDRAVADLAEALLGILRPGARLEPLPTVGPLVGRGALLARLAELLASGQSVALSGASGTGKSSVAAAVAQEWPTPTVFWYTVRPELNDRLYPLLYALGAFLHQHNASTLWRSLTANQGRLEDYGLFFSLARRDLASLAEARPLLIFDEVDLWPEDEDETVRIHEFLAGLQEVSPLLFVGQRVDAVAHQHLALDALTLEATTALLAENGLALAHQDAAQLHNETSGNPRLLWLCIDLLREGEPLSAILTSDDASGHSFEGYLNQLWLRLKDDERQLVRALAVYPTHSPQDSWPSESLARLHARHLIMIDNAGGVQLLPGVRTAVLRTLSAEARERLHQQAAYIYAERAEYTLAAYHLHHGAQPQLAIRLWYPHRGQEILRGQAAAAATIFHNISGTNLNKSDRQTLQIIRAELFQLTGKLEAGLEALRSGAEEDASGERQLELQRLTGDFLDALRRQEEALAAYDQGLATIARLQQRTVDLHVRRSMVHVRQRDLGDAWQAAQQAHYQAEQLQGLILEEQGDLGAAESHYATALDIATVIDDARGLAETNRCLCNLHGRRGEVAIARSHAEAAIAHYERMGDLVNVALVQSNLAAAYLDAGEFAQVLAVGEPAFDFFRDHGFTHRLAATACNLAEAHYELGDLDAAEFNANLAIRQEEPVAIPYATYTLALVAQAQDNLERSLRLLAECCAVAQTNEDIFIEAYAWLKRAEILADNGAVDPGEVEPSAAASRASDLFQRLGLEEMAEQAARLQSR